MLNTLRTKPLLCFSLVFLAGSCFAVYIPTLPKVILAGLFLVSAILVGVFGRFVFRKYHDAKRLKTLAGIVLACGFVSFGVSYFTFDVYTAQFTEQAECEDNVTLEITEIAYTSSFGARYYAKVVDSGLFDGSFRIILDSHDPSYLPRDRMTGRITYKKLQEDTASFDEQRYALSKRIVIAADDSSLTYQGRNSKFSLSYFFTELNHKLCSYLYRYTGEENGSLAAALLLGRKDELSDTLQRDFRRLGMIHMLCLSGAHLAILTTLSDNILLKMKVGKKKRAFFNICAVLFFMALTGFSPSLTRAGVMVILANIASLTKLSTDYPTSLTLACGLLVAVNPFSALDYGLHLSFAAAHSCYISNSIGHRFISLFKLKKMPHRKARRFFNRIIRYIVSTVIYNLVITVHILPLLFLYYGEMSLASLPANLIYMPVITLLMYAVLLFYLLSPFLVFSAPLAYLITALTSLISSSAEAISSLRGIVLPLNYWFTPIFIIPIVIFTAAAFSGRKKTIRLSSICSMVIFALFLGTVGIHTIVEKDHVTVEYITKGSNDGILMKSGGQLLVCEMSDGSYTFASTLSSHRSDFNCAEIEAYMLTHYHTKHVAALSKLTDRCIIRTLILPEPVTESDSEVFGKLVDVAEEKNIRIVITDRSEGDTVYFNKTEIETYQLTILSRSTHPVVDLRLSYGGQELMLLGGSFNEGSEIIREHARDAEVIIFGCHSPVYKKVFDPVIAESKTVYLSEKAEESLRKLTPDITGELKSQEALTPGEVISLD